jgi:hypothetical protein
VTAILARLAGLPLAPTRLSGYLAAFGLSGRDLSGVRDMEVETQARRASQ